MAKQTSQFLPTGLNAGSFLFVNGSSTTLQTLITAAANDTHVYAIIGTNNDASNAIAMQLWITRNAVDYLIGTINIPASSGFDGIAAAVDLLNATAMPGLPINNVGKRYIPLKTGDVLKAAPKVAVTSPKSCYVAAFADDY